MAVNWTEEQKQVIDRRGCSILVSAAAGSGKTAVLVARILAMITDEKKPVDIDRLLVVTFTNAAAAEMRERIRDALEQRAEAEPDNVHLQRQLVLIHNAKITTIHSFCLHVLRNHFQTIGLDPSFRVADEGEVILLEQDAVKETVDAAYEESDKEYLQFLEQFATGKSDQSVEDAVLQLYHFAQGQPWPLQWLEECCAAYAPGENIPSDESFRADTPWMQYIIEETERQLEEAEEQTLEAIRIAGETDGPYPYLKALESDLEMIERIRSCSDYDSYAEAFRNMGAFARLGTKKDDSISEKKRQRVQNIRSGVKDGLARLRQSCYYDRAEVLREEFEKSGLTVRALTKLTEDFMERFARKKAEKNILDFSDLEHLALQVLAEHRDGENIPTAAAGEYAEAFEEIMIDEYQDSNLVQELILNSVSGRGKGEPNLFMVGDVKQSIYRFRLARPELFMEKYKTYQKNGEKACRIDLHRNFRSRPEVLEGVNYIFRQIMTENPGQIVYDKDAALYPGAEYPQGNPDFLPVELLLLEAEGQERQKEEAKLVGQRIRSIVGREKIRDKEQGCVRPVGYGDIVILLRTVSGWADTFGEVLGDMGIPCFTGSQKGYFSALEIRTVLSYLEILDNPVQDIPLAAVLRSPIGKLTDEELAQIRSFTDQPYFYDCVQSYRESGENVLLKEKLERFFAVYDSLREKCGHTPVHLLLWELLDVTGYGAYAQSLPAGQQRKANLDMLVEKAIAYESTSYRGLYHFVRYIKNLKKYEVDFGEANTGSEGENTVRIMSIHKSKGLEFPVVFVSGLGKQFNESDIRSKVVMHPEFGIGCDCVDPVLRTRRATLLKKTIQQKSASENLGEELRVLYVAMTRAREKLILTGSVADVSGRMEKWSIWASGKSQQLSSSCLSSASSYLDWVVPALLRHPCAEAVRERPDMESGWEECESAADGGYGQAQFLFRVVYTEDTSAEEVRKESSELVKMESLLHLDSSVTYDKETEQYLEQVFSSGYPYEADRKIPGKLSVSELKKRSYEEEEGEGQELYGEETVIPLIPSFRGEKTQPDGAARGTVYHIFMENLNFSRKDELELQLEELISCGKMTQEEAAVLDLDDFRTFLGTKTGRRMEQAALCGQLYREQPFVLGVSAGEISADWNPEETVLVQGIIDAYFREEGRIVLLDYKTDRVNSPQILAEKYRTQLDYYTLALERLTGLQVSERIIYSFHLGREIIL